MGTPQALPQQCGLQQEFVLSGAQGCSREAALLAADVQLLNLSLTSKVMVDHHRVLGGM